MSGGPCQKWCREETVQPLAGLVQETLLTWHRQETKRYVLEGIGQCIWQEVAWPLSPGAAMMSWVLSMSACESFTGFVLLSAGYQLFLKKYRIGNSLMHVLGRNEHPGRVKGSEPCVHSSSVGGNPVRPLICYFIDPLQSHKELLR